MIRVVSIVALLTVAVPAFASDPVNPAPDPNKVRCKRESVTGSLAQSTKICHTEAEWQQLTTQARSEASRMQTLVNSRGGGH